ncbi:rRNA maturation RNase YbeY [Miniphocaeibacter massiliensis]|uniref:rRNA maturation RNase YbeY n=1 Tax=Miniphocaeibacter massiliensis TaxID=2041841 RepID=UPI000C07BFDF|nr:rRNA maturation RNase YbeY [Miniphocaeibacter massiliensis]
MEVLFDNRQDKYKISEDLKLKIANTINETIKVENYNNNIEISVSFVTNEEIKSINKKYRGKDEITDVLSFPMEFNFEIEDVNEILGDIIISVERAKEQSLEFSHSFEREILYLVIHSMFHLYGYDHLNEDDKIIMRSKEKEVIRNIGIYKNE